MVFITFTCYIDVVIYMQFDLCAFILGAGRFPSLG